MTMAKKKTMKKAARTPRATRRARGAGEVLRGAWVTTQKALASAEAGMGKQVKELLKKNKIDTREAASALRDLGTRLRKERKKALKEIEAGVSTLQARVGKERKAAGRMVDDAVKRALAAFNIPSRHEVAELTRKVDELSRKIDGFKRRR